MRQALILFGRIVKPHGLKGEICVDCYAASLFSFENVRRIYLQREGKKPKPFVLESWRLHRGRFLLCLERIHGRDEALQWVGAEVLVRSKDFPPPEEDEVFLAALTGFSVCLPTGERVGTILDFYDYGASPLAVIEDETGTEILLPMAPEFIETIDAEKQLMTVVPPEGLLALYSGHESSDAH